MERQSPKKLLYRFGTKKKKEKADVDIEILFANTN